MREDGTVPLAKNPYALSEETGGLDQPAPLSPLPPISPPAFPLCPNTKLAPLSPKMGERSRFSRSHILSLGLNIADALDPACSAGIVHAA